MSECPLCDGWEGLAPHLSDKKFYRSELHLERARALDTGKVFHLLTVTDMDTGDEAEWNIRFCPLCGRDLREVDE